MLDSLTNPIQSTNKDFLEFVFLLQDCLHDEGLFSPDEVSKVVSEHDLAVSAVLSGNRNFEGRQGRGARTHLVSPAMAAAAAITGRFADVRDYQE